MTTRRLLFIGYVWPEPRSSAAGSRVLGLIRCFREAGWTVEFASACKDNEHRQALEDSGVRTHAVELNHSGFDALVRELAPEAVVFDRFVTEEQFGWRVREAAPNALRVLDTEDLHFLRRAREKAVRGGLPVEDVAACRFDLFSEDFFREASAIARSDLTLLISPFERELLLGLKWLAFSEEALLHVPLLYDFPPAPRPYGERAGFAMIGNFRHPPNADGAFWFAREIWPRLRELVPDAEAHLYGAYPPREIMALDRPSEGLRVHGWAPDQFEALARHRVSLAPLRFGAGQKGKIADSWWTGTPAVTTSIGIEGMIPAEEATEPFVADEPREFARKAAALYLDEGAWNRASERGREWIRDGFLHERFASALVARVEKALEDLEGLRKENLLGALLWMNQNRATEYFGRWLELKGRSAGSTGAQSKKTGGENGAVERT